MLLYSLLHTHVFLRARLTHYITSVLDYTTIYLLVLACMCAEWGKYFLMVYYFLAME